MNASSTQNHAIRGLALVAFAAALWGTTGTAQSFSPATLSPYWIGSLRLGLAALFFILIVATRMRLAACKAQMATLDWRMVPAAAVSMAIYNLAFFAGVKATGVAVGTALAIGSGPIWAGLMQMLLGRLPQRGWWAGTVLAVLGGIWLILGRGGGEVALNIAGVALCLTAGFSYALYAILNKPLVERSDPALVTLIVFGLGAFIAGPAAWWVAGDFPMAVMTPRSWAVVLFLGFIATGIAYLLFSWGLRHVSAATGVSLALIEPVTAFLLAIAVVGERPKPMAYAGLAALLIGLAIVIRSEIRGGRR